MSIKELTAPKHKQAETTKFMQAVFAGKMTPEVWADWTWQKEHFYKIIEYRCGRAGLMNDLMGLHRSDALREDYDDMVHGNLVITRKVTHDYCSYLNSLDPSQLLAHLYVWHMGDLFGGQMIKRVLPNIPHRSLDFNNADLLKTNLRAKITDDLADEANRAFDWAIKILEEYNDYFYD
jgi:heme oxygenase